jgi:hypothetical protein
MAGLREFVAAAVVAGGACVASAVVVPPRYLLTDLGPADLSYTFQSINSVGQIVGTKYVKAPSLPGGYLPRPVLWSPTVPNGPSGAMTFLPFPGSAATPGYANAINDKGQVIGGVGGTAVRWDASGGAAAVTPPTTIMKDATAVDINNAGQVVVGTMNDVLLLTGSTVTTLGAGNGSLAFELPNRRAINGYGQVVLDRHDLNTGTIDMHLWTPLTRNGTAGSLTAIPTTAANQRSEGISGGGVVIGGGGPSLSFLWEPDVPNGTTGTSSPLVVFGQPALALGIDDAGDIVGVADGRGFLWTPEAGAVDLKQLLDPADAAVVQGVAPVAINAQGQIVANAVLRDGAHDVLLTPIPEPALVWLVPAAAILWSRRRRGL